MRSAACALVVLLAASARGQEATCTGEAQPAAPACPTVAPAPSVRWHDAALGATCVAVAAGGIAAVRRNERRRRARAAAAARFDGAPYATGAALGLVFALSMVAFGRTVGVSGAVQHLAGALGHRLAPGVAYWGGQIPIGVTWQVWVVAGVFAGGLLSAALAGRLRASAVPDAWRARFGPSVALRFAVAFAGGALIEFAAAIAGGCTSGLALSGGIALAPGAFLFMAAMFATGVPAAWLAERRRR